MFLEDERLGHLRPAQIDGRAGKETCSGGPEDLLVVHDGASALHADGEAVSFIGLQQRPRRQAASGSGQEKRKCPRVIRRCMTRCPSST